MARATVYSIVLAPELRDAFLAAAAASERPPAQVLRGLMRDFIQRQQEGDHGDAGADTSVEGADIVAPVTDEAIPAAEVPGIAEETGEATPA
jgi:hypothetical protein